MDVSDELKRNYIKRRLADLELCQKAVVSGDFTFLQTVGHNMKGNAVSFGFDELAEFGEKLETYALNKETKKIIEVLAEISSRVNKFNQEL